MKPLTDAEIAELRRAMGFDDLSAREYIDACLERLLDEVTRSRALLKRIEWDGAAHRPGMFCASCGGFQPTEGHPAGTTETMFNVTLHYGHREGCELAALIGGGE